MTARFIQAKSLFLAGSLSLAYARQLPLGGSLSRRVPPGGGMRGVEDVAPYQACANKCPATWRWGKSAVKSEE